ncbi:MAG: MBL fold metallo-hydrolase [Caldilineaceae bacterium]|nr:MBL fold metallo-hydrolase [Caldilineaceae bacterium]
MAYTVKVGDLTCHIVDDGKQLVDGGGYFGVVPRILWQRVIQPDENHMVPSATRSLLIEADAGLILVDTGNGDKLSAKERSRYGFVGRADRLIGEIASVGYRPEDVAIVILTHLHADHAGGATRWDTLDYTPGQVIPTFPNARYIAQRIDLAEASFPNERTLATFHSHNWLPLLERDQLTIVDGPQQVATGVRTDIAPGHTAALQMVWVESSGANGEESLLFLGDACSWASHMDRLAWVPAFDLFPQTSIETKRRIAPEALQRNTLLVFQHDAQIVTGRLVAGGRGPQVQPVISEEAWHDAAIHS